MLLQTLFSSPITFFIYLIAIIIAITIHEFAHAYIADRLGDPTPRLRDRVSLNPSSHIDPIGFISLFLVGFGWGKPVPYDPYNLTNPKKDSLLIALAGPTSNLILALLLSLIIRFTNFYLLIPIISINVSLAIFNLLPIPPLDGSKILSGLLSNTKSIIWENFMTRNNSMLLLLFIFPIIGGQSLTSIIISPIINLVIHFLYLIANIN